MDYWFYVAKCVLGFSAFEAWRLTVRQIFALLYQHKKVRGQAEEESDEA